MMRNAKQTPTFARHCPLLTTLLWVLCSLLLAHPTLAAVVAEVDRNEIGPDETVELHITTDESSVFGGPELEELQEDFEIINTRKSTQVQIINGENRSSTEWTITLAPKRQGEIIIPAIEVSGETTEAITLQVRPQAPATSVKGELVYAETSLSQSDVYVQQQLILTVTLYSALPLANLSITELNIDNAFVESLGNNHYRRTMNGRHYLAREVRYAIFPHESGQLIIPSLTIEGEEGNGSLFRRGRPIRVRSEERVVQVKDVPSSFQGSLWLPAESLRLEESWSQSPEQVKVGDSITRTVTVTANGLLGEQLPPLTAPVIDGFKVYPDQGSSDKKTSAQGITGMRKDSYALVPTQPGRYTLPEVSLQWWDTESDSMKTTTLPERILVVVDSLGNTPAPSQATPLPAATTTPTVKPDESPSDAVDFSEPEAVDASSHEDDGKPGAWPWQIATAILALLWLISTGLWLKARRHTHTSQHRTEPRLSVPSRVGAPQLYQNLEAALKAQDAAGSRNALIAWAKHRWPKANIHCLADVSAAANDDVLQEALRQLDECLYKGGALWPGDHLLKRVQALHQDQQATSPIESLYGNEKGR